MLLCIIPINLLLLLVLSGSLYKRFYHFRAFVDMHVSIYSSFLNKYLFHIRCTWGASYFLHWRNLVRKIFRLQLSNCRAKQQQRGKKIFFPTVWKRRPFIFLGSPFARLECIECRNKYQGFTYIKIEILNENICVLTDLISNFYLVQGDPGELYQKNIRISKNKLANIKNLCGIRYYYFYKCIVYAL